MSPMPTAESIYLPSGAWIARIETFTERDKLFTVELPRGQSLGHKPGQFVEVSVFGVGEAPISIASSPSRSNGRFELCVRKAGDVTTALHNMKEGATIGIRGPLGRPFPLDDFRGKDLLVAAGGLSLAPLRSVIYQVLDNRREYGRVIVLYSAATPNDLLFKDELRGLQQRQDVELLVTVDRGGANWFGNTGVITTLFPKVTVNPHNTVAILAGPQIMYRFALMETLGKGIPEDQIWVSLERRMECGVGKCGHCQINNLSCCQDGPSFSYAQIKGVEEAL